MAKNRHIGSSFDGFLLEDETLGEATALAIKRVIAWQFKRAMKVEGLTKTDMAKRMQTSRAALDRLLDKDDTGLTIETLSKGAQAVGFRVKVELVGDNAVKPTQRADIRVAQRLAREERTKGAVP